MPDRRPVDESVVLVDGPWRHRDISANGIRFHAAELGDGPLVVLLHGFPQFWWSWRHQLTALAGAGYRVVAPDLRGYGASDKPPRGFDGFTLADDVAGMVRALGARDAVLVGHDWGGYLAWCVAALHPPVVRRLAVLSMPHPLRLRAALLAHPAGRMARSTRLAAFQVPWQPERWLVRDDAHNVGALLREWSGPGWPDEESERRYRQAVQVGGVAHSALEYHRWLGRSQLRPDGRRFAQSLRRAIPAPTLQMHGGLDGCIPVQTAQGSSRYVGGPYEWRLLPAAGHFPQEEDAATVSAALTEWLTDA